MVSVNSLAAAIEFDFDERDVTCLSRGGNPYRRSFRVGMPRLHRTVSASSFFLFRTAEDATVGENVVGTGFIIQVPHPNRPQYAHLFAVTNWHVACSGGGSVIRLNKKDGTSDILEYGPEDWIFQPMGYDIAMLHLDIKNIGEYDQSVIPVSSFANPEIIGRREIGPGEDVFMVGVFVDHATGHRNVPALRFGHISMMPLPIPQSNGASPSSYCIDMHSRTGFSGSPVFVYRTLGQDLTVPGNSIVIGGTFMYFLGIHFAQFPERFEIKRGKNASVAKNSGSESLSLDVDGHYIEGMSGMTCVAPAQAMIDLMKHPKLQRHVDKLEDQLLLLDNLGKITGLPKGENS